MKTIKIFFSFIALFFTLTSNAQLSQWWISAADGNPGSKIATDQWDNVYTTVTSAGLVFTTGDTALAQGSSVFVYKQNSAGNLVWVKSFSALINGAGSGAIKTDANGFIYITGGGVSMQLDSFIVNGSFIAKLNPANGNVIWAKPMPGACNDIDFDASGNIYSTFHSNSSAYFDTVWVVNNWGVGKGLGVGKMDNNGKVQWVKIYHALGATDNTTAIAVNSTASKVAFTGYFTSSLDVNGTMLTSTPQTTFIVELNTVNGSNSLVKKAGGKVAEDLLYDNYGNILQTGSFKGTSIFGSISLTSKGNNDIFISKWSAAGAIQFVKQIGGTGANSQNMLAGAIGVDGFNNIFLGGRMCETNIMDADTLTAEGASDAFLVKYNSSGVLQWSQPFHGNGDWEAIEDMKVKSDGNIFITGRFDYNYIHLSNDSVYSVCNCNTTNVFTAKLAGYAKKISGIFYSVRIKINE